MCKVGGVSSKWRGELEKAWVGRRERLLGGERLSLSKGNFCATSRVDDVTQMATLLLKVNHECEFFLNFHTLAPVFFHCPVETVNDVHPSMVYNLLCISVDNTYLLVGTTLGHSSIRPG